MVSKFKSLSALEEILARGGNFGRQSQLWRQFQLERWFDPGNYPSTRYVFLDFLLFFFYIVFLFYFIVLYIYYISYLICSLIILFSL